MEPSDFKKRKLQNSQWKPYHVHVFVDFENLELKTLRMKQVAHKSSRLMQVEVVVAQRW